MIDVIFELVDLVVSNFVFLGRNLFLIAPFPGHNMLNHPLSCLCCQSSFPYEPVREKTNNLGSY